MESSHIRLQLFQHTWTVTPSAPVIHHELGITRVVRLPVGFMAVLQARDMVMMAVRSHFRPEFINRIDEFIMFDPLEQEQIKSIVRLQVRCSVGSVYMCTQCTAARSWR